MTGYPRIACYAANRGYGLPLLNNEVVNADLVNALAHYPVVTLNLSPWYSAAEASRTAVPLLLRKANPRISILGYQLLSWWWLGPDFTVASWDKTFAGSWHTAIKETNGFGAPSGSGWSVKWDNPATEAALTELLCGAAASRLFDGLFFDFMSSIPATGVAAMQRMVQRVRDAGGPGFLVLGNGWNADGLNTDGSFREGFPDTLGHDFEHVRLWHEGRPHRSHDWLQAGTGVRDPSTADAQKKMRYALGTACLFDLHISFGPDRDLTVQPSYMSWWFPEYDIVNAMGSPMGPAVRVAPSRWARAFARGDVTVDTAALDATFTQYS